MKPKLATATCPHCEGKFPVDELYECPECGDVVCALNCGGEAGTLCFSCENGEKG